MDTRGSVPNQRCPPKGPDMVGHDLRRERSAGPARRKKDPVTQVCPKKTAHVLSGLGQVAPTPGYQDPRPALAAGHSASTASTMDFSSSDLAQPGPLRVTHTGLSEVVQEARTVPQVAPQAQPSTKQALKTAITSHIQCPDQALCSRLPSHSERGTLNFI